MAALHPDAWRWREFDSRDALAEALAGAVAWALAHEIDVARSVANAGGAEPANASGGQLLAVSGGTTPKAFFNRLSREDAPWSSVIVTLCDERFVPPSSARSNEALVRAELLHGRAKDARFVSLVQDAASVEAAAKIANGLLEELPQPIAVVVLGMGLDGHTASFFPDSSELEHALDLSSTESVIAIHSPSADEPRLTLTLQAIATAFNVFVHIEGNAKRDAFEGAMRTEPALPIRAVIAQAFAESGNPVNVFWAP